MKNCIIPFPFFKIKEKINKKNLIKNNDFNSPPNTDRFASCAHDNFKNCIHIYHSIWFYSAHYISLSILLSSLLKYHLLSDVEPAIDSIAQEKVYKVFGRYMLIKKLYLIIHITGICIQIDTCSGCCFFNAHT